MPEHTRENEPAKTAILNRLRAARRPFADAAPRPAAYQPVTVQADETPEALLARFTREVRALFGDVYVCADEDEARACALAVLEAHQARHILAWDFAHIPISGLEAAVRAAGIAIDQPAAHDEHRADVLARAERAQLGLTGADAALATTGSLVVTTAPGKGRLPTVLAPVHLAIITASQLVPRLETWIAQERAAGLGAFGGASANFCVITGPSRTGDIEMELILGVHGPGKVIVIVRQA
jgi:L-lactate dehydrogenase complex protein LldG